MGLNIASSSSAPSYLEAGWLLAAVITPLFFDVYSAQIFEPDKVALLRSLVLAIGALRLFVYVGERRGRLPYRLPSLPGRPLLLCALVLLGSTTLSTGFSIIPRFSFWGSPLRQQGFVTLLCYIALFGILVLHLRRAVQRERLIVALCIGSLPVVLFGLHEYFTLRAGDGIPRVASTLGNPLFMAAYLATLAPLVLCLVLRAAENKQPIVACIYGVIYLGYLAVLVLTQSRGPLVGLLGGTCFLVLYKLLCLDKRGVACVLLGAAWLCVAGALFWILVNAGPQRVKAGGGFNDTLMVRLWLWRGAAQMVQAEPIRGLVGYGPETMLQAFTPFYPAELASLEKTGSPDRAHNALWDALIGSGVLGGVALLGWWTGVAALCLRRLGWLPKEMTRGFSVLWIIGGVLAGGMAWRVEPALIGVVIPAGLLLGLLSYLLRFFAQGSAKAWPGADWLLAGVCAACISHFIEVQSGIAVVATELLAWMLIALLAVNSRLSSSAEGAEQSLDAPSERWGSLSIGLVLSAMVFDFYRPLLDASSNRSMLWMYGVTWLMGTLLLSVQSASFKWKAREHLVYSLLPPVLFAVCQWLFFSVVTRTTPLLLQWVWLPFLLMVGMMWIVLAHTLSGRQTPAMAENVESQKNVWLRVGKSTLLVRSLVPIGGLLVSAFFLFRPVRADIAFQMAQQASRKQRPTLARVFMSEALRLRGDDDFYWFAQAQLAARQALMARDKSISEALWTDAIRSMETACALNPRHAGHYENSGRIWALWAQTSEAGTRERKLHRATQCFAKAAQLSPHKSSLYSVWAETALALHEPAASRALLRRALALDAANRDTRARLAAVEELLKRDQKKLNN